MQHRLAYQTFFSKLLLLLMLFVTTAAFAESTATLFQSANKYYKNKQYEQAEHFYLQVLAKDKYNINANYNLGNTYHHLHDYPKAVLYYERAKKWEPDNKAINQNLSITNNKLFSKIEFSREFFVTKYSKNFFNSKSARQWSMLMLIFLWLGAIVCCFYFFRQNKKALRLGIFFLLIAGFFAYLSYSRHREEKTVSFAVILQDQSLLQKTPVPASKTIDTVQVGTKIKLLDKDASWYKVELPNGKSGWMESKNLETI